MVEQGHSLLDTALRRAERVRAAVGRIDGIQLMGQEVVDEGRAYETDPLVLTVDVSDLSVSGFQTADWLRSEYQVAVGAADECVNRSDHAQRRRRD